VVALEAALIAIWPSTIAFEATLWKDVPYSIAVLAGTALLYQLSQSRAAAGRRPVQMGLGICMFGAAAFRHNGVVAALCMMAAAILLAWPERRRLLGVAVISLACWAGLRAIAQKMNDVIPVPPGYVAVGYLAAHVAAGTPLNPEEARLVDAIHPLAGGWPYVCGQTDPVTYDGKFNGFGLIREGWTPVWLVAKLTFRRPGPTFRHFRCASRFIWDPTFEQLIGPAIWYDAGKGWTVPPGWAVVALPPSPGLRRWLLGGLLKSLEPRMIELFWSPAWALFLIILASGLVALLEKDWAPLIVFLPILGQTLALAAVAPMPQVRYQFAVLLVAFLFVPGLLYRRLVPHGRPLEAPA
jgi:hypothetical protein